MSDIKYLHLNGTTYNIADNNARTSISTINSYIDDINAYIGRVDSTANLSYTLANNIKDATGVEVDTSFESAAKSGQLIWHNGLLYRVTAAIAQNDAWNESKVTGTTISDEINTIKDDQKAAINNLQNQINDLKTAFANLASNVGALITITNGTA